jgi:EAL domain-containing protein (putative c-di-GMP-specific phosphodiesterase class I)
MKPMVKRYIGKVKKVFQWGKIFLPLSSLRYYPPQFNLRNPVLGGVKAAFLHENDVVVIVFHLKNIDEITEQLGSIHYPKYLDLIKKCFQHAIEIEVLEENLVCLNQSKDNGIALFLKYECNQHCISDIERIMNNVSTIVERDLKKKFATVLPQFMNGYMFVELVHPSVEEAVLRACQQAKDMAEKRVEAKFNEMKYIMRKIVNQKNIRLLAQPIIDVETNQIRAWEMLSRGPKGTVLENPLSLFSVAKQTGTLYDLEMVVLEKTFQQMIETRCKQDIFVNCTPITLGNIRFIGDLKLLLKKYYLLSPKQIFLEITEQDSIEGLPNLQYNLKILRLMGFRVAIDDTGSGYANLNAISEILPDIIKIDRSVIENIDKNSVKESMLKGLLLVAKEAGSQVVAEGIERKEEASVITRNKVHLAQGYFYARPSVLVNSVPS